MYVVIKKKLQVCEIISLPCLTVLGNSLVLWCDTTNVALEISFEIYYIYIDLLN